MHQSEKIFPEGPGYYKDPVCPDSEILPVHGFFPDLPARIYPEETGFLRHERLHCERYLKKQARSRG